MNFNNSVRAVAERVETKYNKKNFVIKANYKNCLGKLWAFVHGVNGMKVNRCVNYSVICGNVRNFGIEKLIFSLFRNL